MSTMLHTVTEMFWMKRDACATKRRKKEYITQEETEAPGGRFTLERCNFWNQSETITCTFVPGIAVNPVANQSPKEEHRAGDHQPKHGSQEQVTSVQLNQEHRDGKVPHTVTLLHTNGL